MTYGKNPRWDKDDWLDNVWAERFFRFLRFLWPFIAVVGGLFLLGLAWRLGPLAFGIIVFGTIYLIMRFRWAMDDSRG